MKSLNPVSSSKDTYSTQGIGNKPEQQPSQATETITNKFKEILKQDSTE